MLRTKFQGEYKDGRLIADWNLDDVQKTMRHTVKFDLIIRPTPEWTTEQMRKYFHGPVRQFFVENWRELGVNKTKDDVKYELKKDYGAKQDKTVLRKDGTTRVVEELKSTGDYTKAEYIELLRGANIFSIEWFSSELPPAEKVE